MKASASVEKSRRSCSLNPRNRFGSGIDLIQRRRDSATSSRNWSPGWRPGDRRACVSPVSPSLPDWVNPFDAASVNSSSSGPVFHRKKESREASSRSVRENSVLGVTPLGPRMLRYRNCGLTSTAATICSIPWSKVPPLTAFRFIERHEPVHIFRGDRPPECAARQVFRDLSGAGRLASLLGIAHEDQGAAGSHRHAGGVERSGDHDAVEKMRPAVGGRRAAGQSAVGLKSLRGFRSSPHGSDRRRPRQRRARRLSPERESSRNGP